MRSTMPMGRTHAIFTMRARRLGWRSPERGLDSSWIDGVRPPRVQVRRLCARTDANPKGSPPNRCDEGHASLEWKAGIDGRRTHLRLGFELRVRQPPTGSGSVNPPTAPLVVLK